MLSWRGTGPRDSGTNRLRSWKLSPSTIRFNEGYGPINWLVILGNNAPNKKFFYYFYFFGWRFFTGSGKKSQRIQSPYQ